jgi:hypothetical protein
MNAIGKEIHHTPNDGCAKEKQRLSELFTKVFDAYKGVFGENPPVEIWFRNLLKKKKEFIASGSLCFAL